jgi:hypothetical protein
MNIHDIILEDKTLIEKPTSSIGNFAKKIGSKVTTGATSARLGGASEVGSKANDIYKDLARWQGINGKNDKNMTAADLAAFMKQHQLTAGGMSLPDGVLPKKIIDQALKKAAAGAMTGGNAAPAQAPAGASGSASPGSSALDALSKGAGGKAQSTQTKAQGSQATTAQPAADPKVTPLKNKGGISPDIQAMIDKLTPTEKKALAGAI